MIARISALVLSMSLICCLAVGCRPTSSRADAKTATAHHGRKVAAHIGCSTLCQAREPLETAAKVIRGLGYRYVDISCLNLPPNPPHVNVAELTKDFEKEASRVEHAVLPLQLKVASLTFEAPDFKDFDNYKKQLDAVTKLAVRLKANVVNVMAPPKDADRADVVAKFKAMEDIAERNGVELTVDTQANKLTEMPADAAWLCEQVPGLGLTLEPGQFYAGRNQGKNFDAVLPYVKGAGFCASGTDSKQIQLPWGEGPIDFTALVQKLEARHYRGFYVADYVEGLNGVDAVEQCGKFQAWSKQLQ